MVFGPTQYKAGLDAERWCLTQKLQAPFLVGRELPSKARLVSRVLQGRLEQP